MSKQDKLIEKIRNGQNVSFSEAESLLIKLGFKVRSKGSHFIFYKDGYDKNVSIKKRNELLPYQLKMLEEVIDENL